MLTLYSVSGNVSAALLVAREATSASFGAYSVSTYYPSNGLCATLSRASGALTRPISLCVMTTGERCHAHPIPFTLFR